MQLVESGAVGLDVARAGAPADLDSLDPRITVRQLLNHSSGIPNPPPLRWIHPRRRAGPRSEGDAGRALLDRYGKPKFEPGDRSAYTNVGFLVLGELIAEVSGQPYKEYVVARVMKPIGARSQPGSRSDRGRAGERGRGHSSPARSLSPAGAAADPELGDRPAQRDGGALFNSVLPRWLGLRRPGRSGRRCRPAGRRPSRRRAVGGARILLPRAPRRCSGSPPPARSSTSASAGSGVIETRSAGLTHVEHLGGGAAYGTVMRLYPDRGIGLVAMANVSSNRFKHEALLAPLARR